jgi:hypothetical protein
MSARRLPAAVGGVLLDKTSALSARREKKPLQRPRQLGDPGHALHLQRV